MWIPINEIDNLNLNQTQQIVYTQQNNKVEQQKNTTKFNSPFKFKVVENQSSNFVDCTFKLEIKYDYQTNTFRILINIYKRNFINSFGSRLNISVQVNNDSKLTKAISNDSNIGYKLENFEFFNSTSFDKPILIDDIKTISIKCNLVETLSFGRHSATFVIAKNDQYNNVKKDYLLDDDISNKIQYVVSDWIDSKNQKQSTYQTITFKPIKLKPNENRTKFILLNYPNEPFQRSKIEVNKIHNIPFSKDENIDLDVSFRDNAVTYDKNTYYDFVKNKIVEGFGNNSNSGYFIPYNFYGKIYPYVSLNINGIKNIKVSWTQNIKKPYFDFKNGLIKLNLNTDNNENNNDKKWCNIPINFFDDEQNKDITLNEIIEKLEKVNKSN